MVALTVELMVPPAMVRPPVVMRRSPALMPALKDEEAAEVFKRDPEVRVIPFEDARPAAERPPVKVEVAPVFPTMRLPPAMVMPPVVIRRSEAAIPPAKDEEAVADELMAPVPVRVRPFELERPAEVMPPAKVEEPRPCPTVRRSAPMVPETESCA